MKYANKQDHIIAFCKPNKRIIRKLFLLLPVLIVFAAWGFCVSEEAVESGSILEINASVFPERLIRPDEVRVSVSITNTSDIDAQSVTIRTDNGEEEVFGSIPAGETKFFEKRHFVTDEEFRTGNIVYHVSCEDIFKSTEYNIVAYFATETPNPKLDIVRRVSCDQFTAGSTLGISYELINAGNVALQEIELYDPAGDFRHIVDRLEPEERVFVFNQQTLNEEVVSKPRVEYRSDSEGSESLVKELDELPIHFAKAELSYTFSVTVQELSEGVQTAELIITNTGNSDYHSICVYDDVYGGTICELTEFPASSESKVIMLTYAADCEDGIRWRIVAVDAAGGKTEILTDTLYAVDAEIQDPSNVGVTVNSEYSRLLRAGKAKILISIANNGDASITDIVLSEENQGVISEMAVIPKGAVITKENIVDIDGETELSYSVTYNDIEGWKQSVAPQIIRFVIASDGIEPYQTVNETIGYAETPLHLGGTTGYYVLLGSAVVVLIVLVVILIIATSKAKIREQVRKEVHRQRRKTAGRKGEK